MRLTKRYPIVGEREKLIRLIRHAIYVHPLKSPRSFQVQAGEDRSEILLLDKRRITTKRQRPAPERVLRITATKRPGQNGSRAWTLWFSYWEQSASAPGAEPFDVRYGRFDYIGDVAKAAALWPEAFLIEEAIDVRLQDELERALSKQEKFVDAYEYNAETRPQI